MSDAVSSLSADEARVAAAALRVAVATANDRQGPDATPIEVERGHSELQSAQADLVQAEAAVRADQARADQVRPTSQAPGASHGEAVANDVAGARAVAATAPLAVDTTQSSATSTQPTQSVTAPGGVLV